MLPSELSKSILLIAIFTTMAMPLVGCGGGGDDEVSSKSPDDKTTIVPPTDNTTTQPPTSHGTTIAPAPIYEAKNIAVDESVSLINNSDSFYAIKLNEKGLYSFDYGTEKQDSEGAHWEIYNANGTLLTVSNSLYSRFGWTPPETGIYFIRAKRGTMLTIRSHGTATSNPYKLEASPSWLTKSLLYTFGNSSGTASFVLSLYEKDTYRFTLNNTGRTAGEFVISTAAGKELSKVKMAGLSTTTQTISINTSDIYYGQFNQMGSDAGAIFAVQMEYLPDADRDGDPDETDPYPNDPKRNSDNSGGNGNGGGNSGGNLSQCDRPYTGDTSDIQVYAFDYIAQFDQCAYRATGDTSYITDGDAQCKVLDGMLKSTNGKFKPLYCSGAKLIR